MRGIVFDTEEKVLYEVRRHWLYLVELIGVVLGISYIAVMLFKASFLVLGGLFLVWYFFMDWKNCLWIITNKRLINKSGVFTKNLIETPLEKINNVIYKKDFLGMIFNYGTVYVESAAKDGAAVMKMVPNPEKFLQKISEAKSILISDSLMECPYCKEVIKKGALRCRFCGADLKELYEVKQEATVENNVSREEAVYEVPKRELAFEEEKPIEDMLAEEEKNIYKRKVDLTLG
jgi:hypothetical protein